MTKDELIAEILKFVVPVQERHLRSYSQERLEDYLSHLRAMGRPSKAAQLATARTGRPDMQSG